MALSLRRRSYLPRGLEWFALGIVGLLYRVRWRGTEQIPAAGGAVIIANYLSRADAVVLQRACPRPIRFVGFDTPDERGAWGWLFRRAGAIRVEPRNPAAGLRRAVRAARAGEIVAIFPEGEVSRTGQLMALKRGFEVVARQAGVPVIPAAIDGLWGSIFSWAEGGRGWRSPRLTRTPVFVQFGAPLAADALNVAGARRALLDAGAEAFQERPVLRRHLGRECVRALVRHPGRVTVIDRTAERRVVKAGQIAAAAAALSRRWRRTIPERRVGIVLPPGAGAFIANLAVLCAGKVPVNLNFTAGRAALESSLRLGGIGTVVSAEAMRAKVADFPWPERTLDLRAELAAMGGKRAILPWLLAAWLLPNQWFADGLRLPRRGDDAEAGLLFTSGSSGEPKGVALSHRNILANAAQVSSLSILPRNASLVGCLPLFHSFGFTVTLWYPMLRGYRVVTVPSPLDTRRIIDAIREEGATVLVGAPTFIRPILRKAKPEELRSLDLVVTGAEKLPPELYDQFLAQFHLEIMEGYGLTETTPVSNVNQPDSSSAERASWRQTGKRRGSTGRLLPGMTVRIVHPETGEEVPAGEAGIVWFRGANVFRRYLGDEEKTKAAFRDGWFVTGDLGRIDREGFLFIEGRLSRFSKIGGEMVPHGTVEQKINEAFGWEGQDGYTVAVTSVPDAAKGEALVVLTTVELGAEELREKLLAAGLPALWVPKLIRRVNAIPVLGTGKLDLKRCREVALGASS